MEKIKIYHGTDKKYLEYLKDTKERNDLDFGNGIYFTTNINQAIKWACRKNKKRSRI